MESKSTDKSSQKDTSYCPLEWYKDQSFYCPNFWKNQSSIEELKKTQEMQEMFKKGVSFNKPLEHWTLYRYDDYDHMIYIDEIKMKLPKIEFLNKK